MALKLPPDRLPYVRNNPVQLTYGLPVVVNQEYHIDGVCDLINAMGGDVSLLIPLSWAASVEAHGIHGFDVFHDTVDIQRAVCCYDLTGHYDIICTGLSGITDIIVEIAEQRRCVLYEADCSVLRLDNDVYRNADFCSYKSKQMWHHFQFTIFEGIGRDCICFRDGHDVGYVNPPGSRIACNLFEPA